MTTETSTTEFTWEINQLEREIHDGFVFGVDCNLVGTRNDGNLRESYFHFVELPRTENPENFVPYEELTHDIVVTWIEQALGENEISSSKACINSQLDEQEAPTKAAGIPWN